jgi:hypothetical protein
VRRFHLAGREKFLREIKERDRRRRVPEQADEVVSHRREKEDRVIQAVGGPLQRPIKIGGRCVSEKKMRESLGDQLPAADERIAQDERLVIPDKTVPQRRRIGSQREEDEQKQRDFLVHSGFDWTDRVACTCRFGNAPLSPDDRSCVALPAKQRPCRRRSK